MSILTPERVDKAPKGAQAELTNLEVREVSLVDRPANKRKFLIVKRDEQGNPALTVEDQDMQNTANEGNATFIDILGMGDSAGQTQDTPQDNTSEVEVVDLPDDQPAGHQLPIAKAVTEALQQLTGLANTGKINKSYNEQETAEISKVADALVQLADKMGASVDAPELEAGGDVVTSVIKATEQLVKVANDVKKLGDTDVPTSVADSLKSASLMLAKSIGSTTQEEDQEQPEQPGEEPIIKAYIDPSDSSEDPMIVIEEVTKAGAKMKKVRLNQFDKAVQILQSLLSELKGEETKGMGGKGKKKVNKSEDDTDLSTLREDLNKALQKGFAKLEERVDEKLDGLKSDLNGQVESVSKRLDGVINAAPAGNADDEDTSEEINKNSDNMWGSLNLLT